MWRNFLEVHFQLHYAFIIIHSAELHFSILQGEYIIYQLNIGLHKIIEIDYRIWLSHTATFRLCYIFFKPSNCFHFLLIKQYLDLGPYIPPKIYASTKDYFDQSGKKYHSSLILNTFWRYQNEKKIIRLYLK